MSAEAVYERDWKCCTKCKTRRPLAKLNEAGICVDGWCLEMTEPGSTRAIAVARGRAWKSKRGGSR